MAEPTVSEERAAASQDRRIAEYWRSVAQQTPRSGSIALGNAKDAAAAARAEDRAADRQENAGKGPRLRRG